MQVLKALVAERLAAAAEEIFSAAEEMIAEKKTLQTPESLSEQQRAAVHKRLSAVAEEIFRILETLTAEREAEVCGSHVEVECQRRLPDAASTTGAESRRTERLKQEQSRNSNRPPVKDASAGSGGEQDVPPSNSSEAESEDGASDEDCSGKTREASRRRGTEKQSCCRVCGKVFRYRRSFLKHVLQHEPSSGLSGGGGEEKMASGSEKTAKTENEPKGAKNKDSPDLKLSCKVCSRTFCYRASFLKHVQEDERHADLCGICGKRFRSGEGLRLHLRTHAASNDCGVCGKRFDGRRQLETHARTHTGERPYACGVCGKAFAQSGNLAAHTRSHTGERPYACSVCGRSFGFKEYMASHMRIHTGEKPFLCSVCGKGFRQRGTLRTHAMIHTGATPPHRCGVCGKEFYKSGALKIHVRSHTGEKPFLCSVCGRSFVAGGSLAKHMAAHGGERTTHRKEASVKGTVQHFN